jgi:F0F1-type ATP synthase assembly protein I
LKPTTSRYANGKTATDDKLGKGIDVALVTLTFLGLGYLLDRWLGTKPVFMIVLVCLALIGEFVRFWYDYDSKMKVLEAERAAAGRSESRGR